MVAVIDTRLSRTGVTGEQQQLAGDLKDFLRALRRCTQSPIAVGFGISRPEHVKAVWEEADGAIVGTSFKSGGRIDSARVERVVRAFKARGGRSAAGKRARSRR